MKCIRCGTHNKYKDRQKNKRCTNCGHEFVFEPKRMNPKITDGFFAKILSDISFNNSIFYTQKQFNYYFDKVIKKRQSKSYLVYSLWNFLTLNAFFILFWENYIYFLTNILLCNIFYVFWLIIQVGSTKINFQKRSQIARLLLIIGAVILTIGTWITLIEINLFLAFVVTTIWGMGSIYFGIITSRKKSPMVQTFVIEQSKLEKWQNQWNSINGLQEKLLPLTPSTNQSSIANSELTNYSFDRLIVCEKADIAYFLLANNFHLENNCAILSRTGYPENIFQTILDMAKQNPNLKVYALHDCSFRGISLVYNLKNRPNWFLNSNLQIYDLGLSYHQVMKIPNAFIRKDLIEEERQLPFEVRQNLSFDIFP